jgi:hypothetical protein
VSAFFQQSPEVHVESFSPVKKGSMMTGDAVLRIAKGLPACLKMQVSKYRYFNLKPNFTGSAGRIV